MQFGGFQALSFPLFPTHKPMELVMKSVSPCQASPGVALCAMFAPDTLPGASEPVPGTQLTVHVS